MRRYSLIVAALPVFALVVTTGLGEDLIIKKKSAAPATVGGANTGAATPVPAAAAAPASPAKGVVAAPSGKAAAGKTVAVKPGRKAVAFKVTVAKGESPRDAWAKFFAARPEFDEKDPQADRKQANFEQDLRQTVRELMEAQKFDHVSGLIESALVAGYPQQWMYQALGISLLAGGAPAEQVERAFLSAIDFAGRDTAQLAHVAHYLSKARFDRRALSLFQQISEIDSSRPEPYLEGMAIARRLDDVEAMKWATLGILRQAWPNNQKKIEDEATMQGNAILARLNKDGRGEDAKAFREEMNTALARDLVVKVSWTGDADIDISMVEPNGTVCSFRNPRTTAGGVLLGDSFTANGPRNGKECSETYVCPQGFKGPYELQLRKVWGNVTANQVTIEVMNRVDADPKRHQAVPIELSEGVNTVQIDLKEGRRKESLTDAQVANAINEQQALGREILAQQVGGVVDPAVARNLAGSRAALANALADNGIPIVGVPVVQGAVGFRPVITTLPEGANLAANAVISADRRYVRITVLPLFSKVGKVLAFNIISGRITEGNPDFTANGGANAGANGGVNAPGGVPR